MAGPLDLRGRATISNGASGTLGAIKRDLASVGNMTGRRTVPLGTAITNGMMSGAVATKKLQNNLVGATAGAWALVSAVRKAESFNRNVFGVGVAAIGDYTDRVKDAATGTEKVVVDFDKVRASMERVSKLSKDLAHEIPETPTKLSGIAETLAKAGFGDEKLAAATKWAAILGSTDTETAASELGEFASVLDTIYKPRQGEAWGDYFKRQLDIVRIAAAETRLSLASTMEGLRPFSALYSLLGNSETDNAMLLMGGVRKGGEAAEVGHTLKSDAMRMLRSTAESTSRFSALGLRRSDYTDLSAMDPTRAAGNLSRVFRSADITGKFRKSIEADMQKAIETGTFDTAEFQDKLLAKVAKRAGVDMKDDVSRESFEDKFNNAIFAGGARFNMRKLFEDLVAKGATAADVGTIFEGRRIGTNIQILEGLKEFGPEFMKKLEMADGTGLSAVLDLLKESDYGRLQKFSAMMEDFQIKLANSGGFQTFLSGITAVFDTLGQLHPAVVNIGVAAGIAAIALTPLAMLFRGLAGMARVLRAALAFVGIGGAAAAAGGAASRMAAGGLAGAGTAAAAGLLKKFGIKGLAKLGARFIPGLGLVVMAGGAGWAAYDAWQRGEDALGIGKSAALGAIGLDGIAQAGEAPAGGEGKADLGLGANADGAIADARSAAEQIRSAFLSVDLSSVGRQMMDELAAGIRSGGAAAVAAANDVAAQVRAAGERVRLNTGPNMQPAR